MHTPEHNSSQAEHASVEIPPLGIRRTGTPAPLSDVVILAVALQIKEALLRPPPDDHTTWVLSGAAELTPADEDRVIAALARLRTPTSELAS
jgi:hypothetical protein